MRSKELFNDDWRFFQGDISVNFPPDKQSIYSQAKTERHRTGPAARAYRDVMFVQDWEKVFPEERWERIRLPHDYVVFGTPVEADNNTRGYLKYDNAWYRKHFTLDAEDEGRRIVVEFEGVSGKSSVFFNGCPVKRNYCGYSSFEVDITDLAKFGDEGENVLAVYIDASGFEGWWYEGSGIYRNVWLRKTDEISVENDGVYVCPRKMEDGCWQVDVETTLYSMAAKTETVQLQTQLIAPSGAVAAEVCAELTVGSYEKATAKYRTLVKDPVLWDVDDPQLYTVRTSVLRDGEVCDVYTTRTGFRHYICDPQRGLILNGRPVKIHGVCVHEDSGLLGKAIPANVHRYKMEMLKEMGVNGYRASHYQQSAAILDAADEMGFIVLGETRWFSSADEEISQLEALVRRDRNRPSVFFWSLGNEEYMYCKPQGRRIMKKMKAALRRLDPMRPVTCATDKTPEVATIFDDVDLIGINYNLQAYEPLHEKYPQMPMLSTENCSTYTMRGWYAPDCLEAGYYSAWDKDITRVFLAREYTWKFIAERPWVMGGYQWNGFDYRGEGVWPRLGSQSGAIDLFLQKKDSFYQNQSFWSRKPMVHIMPHWNVDVFDGEPVPVTIYTNCQEVELRLNGELLGRRTAEKYTPLCWPVEYVPGKLEAVAYTDGEAVAADVVETAGAPVKLRLRLDNRVEKAEDVAIVTCWCEDAEGRFVPNACPEVLFHTNRYGKLLGTGSDLTDHVPVSYPRRRMMAGLVTAAVGVNTLQGSFVAESGTIEVYAQAAGMQGARLKIQVGNN